MHNPPSRRAYCPKEGGSFCADVGGINWGLVGLFQFDFVGWLLGGSASIWSRIVFTLVGVAAVCGIPGLFTDETGE